MSHRLGHASVSVTLSLYAHFVPENDDEAAHLIGNLHSMPDGEDRTDEPLTLVI